jgi:hypothetical protein
MLPVRHLFAIIQFRCNYESHNLFTSGDMTMMYLQQFLVQQFSSTIGVDIINLDYTVLSTSEDPVSIDFDVEVLFSANSDPIPTTAEIDTLVNLAFQEPSSSDLITALQLLPAPFSTTETVSYSTLDVAPMNRSEELLSTRDIGFIVGSAIAAFVCFFGFACRRRLHSYRQVPTEKSKIFPIMPSHSYTDRSSENFMQFRDTSHSSTSSSSFSFKYTGSNSSISSARTSSSRYHIEV